MLIKSLHVRIIPNKYKIYLQRERKWQRKTLREKERQSEIERKRERERNRERKRKKEWKNRDRDRVREWKKSKNNVKKSQIERNGWERDQTRKRCNVGQKERIKAGQTWQRKKKKSSSDTWRTKDGKIVRTGSGLSGFWISGASNVGILPELMGHVILFAQLSGG